MSRETITISPNTYAGKLYAGVALPALLAPLGLIDKKLVTPVPGIKKRTVMRTMTDTVEFQDPSCTFNAQAGTMTLGEKYLDPVKYEVMKEVCWADFLSTWESELMKKGSLNDYQSINPTEADFLDFMAQKIAIGNEQLYLLGKTAANLAGIALFTFTASYPGLLERLRDDSTVNKIITGNAGVSNVTTLALTGITIANPAVVTVASTSLLKTGQRVTIRAANGAPYVGGKTIVGQSFIITVLSSTTFSLGVTTTGGAASTTGFVDFVNATNVIEVLTAAYQNTVEAIRDQPDTHMWVSRDIAQAYKLNQAGVATGQGAYYVGDKKLDFIGNMLVEVPYLPAGTIIVAQQSNIHLGFDDSGDETNLKIVDLTNATLDEVIRYKLSMKTDINHIYGNQITLITPLITTTES